MDILSILLDFEYSIGDFRAIAIGLYHDLDREDTYISRYKWSQTQPRPLSDGFIQDTTEFFGAVPMESEAVKASAKHRLSKRAR